MWDWFKDAIFWVIDFFYNVCGDWGLSIIIVTVIFRLLITPLMHMQTKSSYNMQKVQPLMNEIQTKYANDPSRMQEEMQKLYAEVHFNPLAGCLPMLLQMPIFIALFQVLSEMGERTQGSSYGFYNIIPNLVMRPSEAFSDGFLVFIPYLILLVIFAGATFVPMILQMSGQKDNPQRKQTLIMSGVMSLFMLWIGWGSPAGVLLFWGTSSLLAIAQQQVSRGIMKRQDEEKVAAEPVKPIVVDVTRKAAKPKPKKKGDSKKR